MSSIVKGQKLKIFISLIVITLLMYTLLKIVNGNVSFALLTMYGCTSMSAIMLKAGFFLFVILLQYFNADLILYHVENVDYICIRYGDKKKVFAVLLSRMIFLNIVYVCLSLMGTGVSLWIDRGAIQNLAVSDTVIAAVRGLGNCYLFSLIQVALLKYFDEAKCFAIMSLGAVLITLFNPFNLPVVTGKKFIYQLSFWGVLYLILWFLATLTVKTFFIKEHTHGDRSI